MHGFDSENILLDFSVLQSEKIMQICCNFNTHTTSTRCVCRRDACTLLMRLVDVHAELSGTPLTPWKTSRAHLQPAIYFSHTEYLKFSRLACSVFAWNDFCMTDDWKSAWVWKLITKPPQKNESWALSLFCTHRCKEPEKDTRIAWNIKSRKDNQKGQYYCIRNEREGKVAAKATMPRPPRLL